MISTKQMKKLEDKSEELGVSKKQLMENAGKGINNILKKKFKDLKKKKILIVCHHGNNGGDGFVAARYLSNKSTVEVLFMGKESKLKDEASANFNRIINNHKIQFTREFEDLDFNSYNIIIDAMLGTGTEGKLKKPISSAVDKINKSKAYKVSVDIPTGLNPDTGKVIDKAVKADLIITFHDLKTGLKKLKNKTVVVDIGIPKKAR
ncbi:NAD(P)H-hydrate epimerase [Candidatus Woesearchaeota archaeon]|nr:NAD(P)H-hydrate epimerase [Candidatus Woesearchaeota archaeon]